MKHFQINPIPYLAVRCSMSMAGTNEWGARLIPCLAGVVSIPLLFLMGKSLFNQRVGLLASTFLALSSWHLFWSQNARSYVFTVLFATLAAWSFYRALETDKPVFMVASLVSTILLILSHLPAGMLIPAFAGYAISFWRIGTLWDNAQVRPFGLRSRNLLIFFLPLATPLLLLALPKFRSDLFSGWGLNEWQRSPLYILFTLIHGLGVPVAVVAFFTALTRPADRAVRFLICTAGVPLFLLLIASRLFNVAGYYLFFTAPAYFLLSAVGCDQIWRAKQIPRPLHYILPCVIVVTMLSQDYIYFRVENGGRPKWREAFTTIRSQMQVGDRVVVAIPPMSQYYLPELETISVRAVMDDTEEFERRWKLEGGRVWFVVDAGNFNVVDSGEQFRGWMRQRAKLMRTYPVFARAMDRTVSVYLGESQLRFGP
ncbi:MAG: glycosyltransferase family 39 protein [Candidatus Poribacteria bacterium]|nr:glycosyltransferase family 39 protein [Candidatus Poribacteria bacterium]